MLLKAWTSSSHSCTPAPAAFNRAMNTSLCHLFCPVSFRDVLSGPQISWLTIGQVRAHAQQYIHTHTSRDACTFTMAEAGLSFCFLCTSFLTVNFQPKLSFISITHKALKQIPVLLGRRGNQNKRMVLKLKAGRGVFYLEVKSVCPLPCVHFCVCVCLCFLFSSSECNSKKKGVSVLGKYLAHSCHLRSIVL